MTYYGDDDDLGTRQEANELQAQADWHGRRNIGVLKWDDDRGGFNCTVHPDAAVQPRDGNGCYFAEPTQGGSYLYRCGVCGASAWSGV